MAPGRVAVVGAGLAGLSAAVELRRLGFEVEVFERSGLLGGKVTSYVVGGAEVDNGQHVFLGCCTDFIDFVDDLGMAEKLRLQRRFEVLMLRPGAPPCRLRAGRLPAPLHLLPALLGHTFLDWPARLQIIRAIVEARRPARPDETFAQWLDRYGQGERARRYFWDPFLIPALNATAEEVSAEAARFVIATAFAGRPRDACIGFADVPLARIAEAAAARTGTVHLRTNVIGLLADGGCVRGVRLADGRILPFDRVVLAVPPPALARILGTPERFGITGLDAFRTEPIVDVHLWYDRADLGFGFAALLDSPVQWVFQKAPGYLCCSVSAARALISKPSAELVDLCDRELRAVLPSVAAAQLIRSATTRDPTATFVPGPDLRRPTQATSDPRLAIAGAWTATGWPATMESAVRSGRAAARHLAAPGGKHAA
ncbi:MAG: FAD-dependent oxidoreductase [Chloroflexi bacterium]|nr:FAD-dependent oxidoreductase [Chloroflexota bacterium]